MDVAPPIAPVFLPRKSRWIIGVDLGQSSDPTAICALHHQSGVMDAGSEYERHIGQTQHLQTPAERVDVRHLQRLPLGLSYPTMVQHVKELLGRPPLNDAELIIDETGVGRAVGDIFSEAGMKPIRVSITAGSEATAIGGGRYHVAKTILISNVDAMLHTGVLRFAAALTDAPTMRDELLNFRRRLSDAGRATYSARTGTHDDLVLSVAIAAWWAARPPQQQASFGIYSTTDPSQHHY